LERSPGDVGNFVVARPEAVAVLMSVKSRLPRRPMLVTYASACGMHRCRRTSTYLHGEEIKRARQLGRALAAKSTAVVRWAWSTTSGCWRWTRPNRRGKLSPPKAIDGQGFGTP
jgi:hypothetical protein